MKLQTSTTLALCSVLEAAARRGEQVSAAEIAGKYNVSGHHLAKVLRELARAGLLESTRGVGGGYRFLGNARRLTLMDVIELFEDISARAPDAETGTRTAEGDALAAVLGEIDEHAKATLRSITIETMLRLVARQAPEASAQAALRAAANG